MSTIRRGPTQPFGKKASKKPIQSPFANINVEDSNDDAFDAISFQDNTAQNQGQGQPTQDPFAPSNNFQDNQNRGQRNPSNPWEQQADADLSGNISLNPEQQQEPAAGQGNARRNPINPYAAQQQHQYPNQGPQGPYGNPQAYPQAGGPGQPGGEMLQGVRTAGTFMQRTLGFFGFGGGQQYQPVPGQEGQQGYDPNAEEDYENEPPLLEDLDIDLNLIKQRSIGVLRFTKVETEAVARADMSGPLLLALILGTILLFKGQVTFGYIYGFGVMGTISIWFIINLLSQSAKAELYNTMSILGYCLLPIVILAGLSLILPLKNKFGFLLTIAAVGWATAAASSFFEAVS